jgi:hypothetical protein
MEDFDRERYKLARELSGDAYILVELNTEEKIELDSGHEWFLDFDEDGRGYVSAATHEAEWCEDLFHLTVFQNPNRENEVNVILENGQVMQLVEFQQRHYPISIPVKFVGNLGPTPLKAVVLKQAVSGAWVLWNLAHIYDAVASATNMSASRWYQSWWPWWQKALQQLGVGPLPHLRKAAPTVTSDKTTDKDGDDRPFRFLQECTVSSFALLMILAKSSAPSRGSKKKITTFVQLLQFASKHFCQGLQGLKPSTSRSVLTLLCKLCQGCQSKVIAVKLCAFESIMVWLTCLLLHAVMLQECRTPHMKLDPNQIAIACHSQRCSRW